MSMQPQPLTKVSATVQDIIWCRAKYSATYSYPLIAHLVLYVCTTGMLRQSHVLCLQLQSGNEVGANDSFGVGRFV